MSAHSFQAPASVRLADDFFGVVHALDHVTRKQSKEMKATVSSSAVPFASRLITETKIESGDVSKQKWNL